MGNDSYIAFLLISTLLVVVDAAIITISGRKYLGNAANHGMSVAASWLTTTLFILIVLGLVLLLLAVAHATTMGVLARYRGEERQEQLAEEMTEQRHQSYSTT